MALTLQDKLALALTSAGSQRALAKLVGVSHQKIGRWLREGVPATVDPETGYVIHQAGARAIPEAATDAINTAFGIHIDISKAQARADRVHFDSNYPVFAHRVPLRKDKPGQNTGERVRVARTGFIKPELRDKVLITAQKSKKYYAVSVRSTVNLREYAKRAAATEIQKTGRNITKRKLSQHIMENLLRREGVIVPNDYEMPIFTQARGFGAGYQGREALAQVTKQIKNKHEAAATENGLGDMYLFQTPRNANKTPNNTRQKSSTAKRRADLYRR